MTSTTRRGLLMAALFAPLSACSTRGIDSTDATGATNGQSSASIILKASETADDEAAQGAWLTTVAANAATWQGTPSLVSWCTAQAAAHTAHAAYLSIAGHDTTSSPNATPAATTPTFTTVAEMQAQVAATEQALATKHAQRAQEAEGWQATLFASLAAFALSASAFGPAPTASQREPGAFQSSSTPAALAVTIGYVDQLVYALQTGMGRLPSGNDNWSLGQARLVDLELLRDSLAAHVRADQGTVPAVQSVYSLPDQLETPDHILAWWGSCERDLLDSWGPVVAAATPETRPDAVAQMNTQAIQPAKWGQPITWWPGWQD